MPRLIALALLLLLVACKDTVEDAGAIAYEGPAEIAPSPVGEPVAPKKPSLDGRYGASPADCDTGNRYMTEYVEIEQGHLSYRGEKRAIAEVGDTLVRLVGGERLARAGNALIRWPHDKRRRTIYTRCAES